MLVNKHLRMRVTLLLIAVSALVASVSAQTPQAPKKASSPTRATGGVVLESREFAPQVVTIVHRLNGLKMFRLLLRTEEQVQAIARLDNTFRFNDEVHTNVIAGLAMDDGQTIVAWLPEAAAEPGPLTIPFPPPQANPVPPAPTAPRPISNADTGFPGLTGNFFGPPDLTVIRSDGKRVTARYVGLDGATGLSILRLASQTGGRSTANSVTKDDGISAGQNVRLFGPEPVAGTRSAGDGSVYVRMGETQGTILNVKRVPTGHIASFKVRSAHLSLANIGGVAVNDDGETVGMVDGIDDGEASILPTATIRQAAKRVLARQSSVPKLWLGVKGEPIATTRFDQILNLGWETQRAASLTENHHGILLTWIAPGSPAALAALRAGDVILKVDDEAIQTADDFSWLLDQAGPNGLVRFTVARPEQSTPEAINVKLSESLDPNLSLSIEHRAPRALIDQGIETIALKPAVASRLGASAGLLVIYLQPSTCAFKAGLRPGDVIEAIDGKQVSAFHWPTLLSGPTGVAHTFNIVRNMQKLVLTVVSSKPQE